MEEPVKAVLWLAGLCFATGCAGAAFMAGAAMVGRFMKWAPVNVTVNVNDYRDVQ